MCKLGATQNFFSTVAGNITVKAKRKSNFENYNLILCFAVSAFSLTWRFKDATAARMSKKQQVLLSKTTTLHVPRTFFVHFFPGFARPRRENAFSRFMEDVNKQRRNFTSLSELGYGPLKYSFGMVRLHLTSKWVGIITIKTERTQIHFLSDVFVAVASLDLKLPYRVLFIKNNLN